MTYRVQIVERRPADGVGAIPLHHLPYWFATIDAAQEAGQMEVARLRGQGRKALYNILDQDGIPVGQMGPPNIPGGYGIM
jgi:hypothetical protein